LVTALLVPQIVSTSTYTEGRLVYFQLTYTDPGGDAAGFGFAGVNGSHWAAQDHPLASPAPGIAGTGSVAYPLNLECGTARQYRGTVEAWIYDTAGHRSQSVVIALACSG
jgi:hypothetical protein